MCIGSTSNGVILCAVANPLQSCHRCSRVESQAESTFGCLCRLPQTRPCGRISRQSLHHTRCFYASSCLSAAETVSGQDTHLLLLGGKLLPHPFHEGRYTLLEAESESPVPEVEALSSRPGESGGPPIPTAAPFSSPLAASTKKERSRSTDRLSPSQGRSASQSHSNV